MPVPDKIQEQINGPIRKEVHTRTQFSHDIGVKWFGILKHDLKTGNIMSSKASKKFSQSRRIYIYYTQEYQKHFNLPLTK